MKTPVPEKPIEHLKTAAETAARKETAPPWQRRVRHLVFRTALLLVAVSFSILAFLVTILTDLPFDLQFTQVVQGVKTPLFGSLMTVVSWPGFTPQSIILVALVSLAFYLFGLHWEAVMAFGGAALVEGINALVKFLIHRPRPAPDLVRVVKILDSYSFPSGHVMFYTAFLGFVWYLVFTLLKKSPFRTVLLILLAAFILLIGLSRVNQGQHWASDVIGAYLLGILTLVLIVAVYRWGKGKVFQRQPVAPQSTASEAQAAERHTAKS